MVLTSSIRELDPDLVISLGPQCRNTFNVRSHFGVNRAYPFNWWITPMASALHMLQPEFVFDIALSDLVVDTGEPHNTMYDRKLHVLHHHDFHRKRDKVSLPDAPTLMRFKEKYRSRFRRLQDDLSSAERILFVVGEFQRGLREVSYTACTTAGLDRDVSLEDADAALNDLFGTRAHLLIVSGGGEAEAHAGRTSCIRRPDDGSRLYPAGHRHAYAEPTNVYAQVFGYLGLAKRHGSEEIARQIQDPEVELQAAS